MEKFTLFFYLSIVSIPCMQGFTLLFSIVTFHGLTVKWALTLLWALLFEESHRLNRPTNLSQVNCLTNSTINITISQWPSLYIYICVCI